MWKQGSFRHLSFSRGRNLTNSHVTVKEELQKNVLLSGKSNEFLPISEGSARKGKLFQDLVIKNLKVGISQV